MTTQWHKRLTGFVLLACVLLVGRVFRVQAQSSSDSSLLQKPLDVIILWDRSPSMANVSAQLARSIGSVLEYLNEMDPGQEGNVRLELISFAGSATQMNNLEPVGSDVVERLKGFIDSMEPESYTAYAPALCAAWKEVKTFDAVTGVQRKPLVLLVTDGLSEPQGQALAKVMDYTCIKELEEDGSTLLTASKDVELSQELIRRLQGAQADLAVLHLGPDDRRTLWGDHAHVFPACIQNRENGVCLEPLSPGELGYRLREELFGQYLRSDFHRIDNAASPLMITSNPYAILTRLVVISNTGEEVQVENREGEKVAPVSDASKYVWVFDVTEAEGSPWTLSVSGEAWYWIEEIGPDLQFVLSPSSPVIAFGDEPIQKVTLHISANAPICDPLPEISATAESGSLSAEVQCREGGVDAIFSPQHAGHYVLNLEDDLTYWTSKQQDVSVPDAFDVWVWTYKQESSEVEETPNGYLWRLQFVFEGEGIERLQDAEVKWEDQSGGKLVESEFRGKTLSVSVQVRAFQGTLVLTDADIGHPFYIQPIANPQATLVGEVQSEDGVLVIPLKSNWPVEKMDIVVGAFRIVQADCERRNGENYECRVNRENIKAALRPGEAFGGEEPVRGRVYFVGLGPAQEIEIKLPRIIGPSIRVSPSISKVLLVLLVLLVIILAWWQQQRRQEALERIARASSDDDIKNIFRNELKKDLTNEAEVKEICTDILGMKKGDYAHRCRAILRVVKLHMEGKESKKVVGLLCKVYSSYGHNRRFEETDAYRYIETLAEEADKGGDNEVSADLKGVLNLLSSWIPGESFNKEEFQQWIERYKDIMRGIMAWLSEKVSLRWYYDEQKEVLWCKLDGLPHFHKAFYLTLPGDIVQRDKPIRIYDISATAHELKVEDKKEKIDIPVMGNFAAIPIAQHPTEEWGDWLKKIRINGRQIGEYNRVSKEEIADQTIRNEERKKQIYDRICDRIKKSNVSLSVVVVEGINLLEPHLNPENVLPVITPRDIPFAAWVMWSGKRYLWLEKELYEDIEKLEDSEDEVIRRVDKKTSAASAATRSRGKRRDVEEVEE